MQFDVGLTAVWAGADRPHRRWEAYPLQPFTAVSLCHSQLVREAVWLVDPSCVELMMPSSKWQDVLWWCLYVVPKALMVLYGAYISFQIRNLPDKFNGVR